MTILTAGNPANAPALWADFRDAMSEDFARERKVRGRVVCEEMTPPIIPEDYARALWDLEMRLSRTTNKKASDYQLPDPDVALIESGNAEFDRLSDLAGEARVRRIQVGPRPGEAGRAVFEARNFDVLDEAAKGAHRLQQMRDANNPGQVSAATRIFDAVVEGTGECFFLVASAGTGKTFTINTIIHLLRGRGKIALAVASSGIAAILLLGGRTAHSLFKIPIAICEGSFCSFSGTSETANLLRAADCVIWDEVGAQSKLCVEAVDRSLQDLLGNSAPFGGKTFVFCGDFRQTLPVVVAGNRAETCDATIKRSYLWAHLTKMELTVNMRIQMAARDPNNPATAAEIEEWGKYLLRVGNGEGHIEKALGKGQWVRRLDDKIILKKLENDSYVPSQELEDLIEYVYRDQPEHDAPMDEKTAYYADKAIMTPKNSAVDMINEIVAGRMEGDETTYHSADSVAPGENIDGHLTTEFLNTCNVSGCPPHELKLKPGVVIMCLKNLDPAEGVVNGARMIVTQCMPSLIRATLCVGPHRGNSVCIPRITMVPSETRWAFTFRRRQLPVRLAFAMTIHKSQGQSFGRCGGYLPEGVFGHGLLYVLLSRSGPPPTVGHGVRLLVVNDEKREKQGWFEGGANGKVQRTGVHTKNIVFKDILG